MNKLGALLVFLLVMAAGLMLVMANPQAVGINLYFAEYTLQLGFALLATLGLGLGLAMGLGGWMVLRYRFKLSRLQRQYDLVYQEVRNLRRLPIHEA